MPTRQNTTNGDVQVCLEALIGAATAAVHFLYTDRRNNNRAAGALSILRDCIRPTAQVSPEEGRRLAWECWLLELDGLLLHKQYASILRLFRRTKHPPHGTRLQRISADVIVVRAAFHVRDYSTLASSLRRGLNAVMSESGPLRDAIPFIEIAVRAVKTRLRPSIKHYFQPLASKVMTSSQFATLWRKNPGSALNRLKGLLDA